METEQLLTLGALNKATGISLPTLRRYADAGWIGCQVDSTGRRLFKSAAIEEARVVLARRTQRGSLSLVAAS